MKKCPWCAEEIQDEAIKCKHCGTGLAPPPGVTRPRLGDPDFAPASPARSRLVRSTADAMLGGVCAGLAHWMAIDPTVIRILYALGSFFTAIIPGVIIYILCLFIIPSDRDMKY
jgi:phage shock protein C